MAGDRFTLQILSWSRQCSSVTGYPCLELGVAGGGFGFLVFCFGFLSFYFLFSFSKTGNGGSSQTRRDLDKHWPQIWVTRQTVARGAACLVVQTSQRGLVGSPELEDS